MSLKQGRYMLKLNSIMDNLILSMMGFLVFSPVATDLCIDVLHLPLVSPEILIIPFFFILRKKFQTLRIDKKLFSNFIVLHVLLLIIAYLWDEFQYMGIVSLSRSYLYLYLCLCIFKNKSDFTTEDFLYLSLGGLIGWLFISRIHFARLLVDYNMSNLTYGTALFIPMFLSIAISLKKRIILWLGIGIMILIFIFAGLRRIIALFVFSLVAIYVLQVLGDKKKILQAFSFFVVFIGLILFLMPIIEDNIKDLSPELHYRMFVRTERALDGDSGESEQSRVDNIASTLGLEPENFIPHGYYTNHAMEPGAGVFNDVPMIALIWIFSSPIAWLIIINIFSKVIKGVKIYARYNNPQQMPFIVCCIMLFTQLIMDGSFMSYCYCAPITGICLGRLLYYNKYKV